MDKKTKVGKLNSIGEEDDEGSIIENSQEEGEIFEVDRVIDIRWVHEKKGKVEYRVRWKYYKPIDDTWEPPEHFEEESVSLLNSFNEKYQQMRDELRSYLLERGKEVTTESIRHVNILSNEIDQITEKTTMKEGPKNITAYHVRWLGYGKPDSTWESENELIHAQDKIDMFLHKKRVQKGKRHMSRGKDLQDFIIPDHVKRESEREFYNAIESGKLKTAGNDLYSIVKSRRYNQEESRLSSSELKTEVHQSTGKKKEKQRKQHNGPRENPASREVSSIETDPHEKIEPRNEATDSSCEDSILAELIPYDRDRVKRDTQEQLKRTLILSNTEFCKASEKGDYDTIFASLNSEKIPDVDFTSLFLKASRRGQRDLALLLSTYVPNLSARDEWGESALTIAAKLGDVCFAHYLLVLDVPIGECNSQGQTVKDIAIKFGQMHFVKFLKDYEKGNLTFGKDE